MERFGDYVRKARIERELTIAEVAKALDFSAVHVSDIERGKKNPPPQMKVRKWAQVLGLDPEKLVRRAETDVESVSVVVDHDPQKARLAFAFARRLDGMDDEERKKLMELLGVEEADDE